MRLRVPALAAVLLLLLAGCGEDDASSAVAGEAAQPGPASGVTNPTDPTETESPSDGETTPPGTELSYGDTATVEVETFRVDADDDEPGIAEWTVTSVEPGADTGSEMFAPYRISITLTAVTDLSGSFLLPSIDFEGLDAKGEDTIFNVEPGCESEIDTASLKAGETLELCVAVSAFEQGDLTGVRYTAGDAYDEDTGQPIVWKP